MELAWRYTMTQTLVSRKTDRHSGRALKNMSGPMRLHDLTYVLLARVQSLYQNLPSY